MYCRNCGNEIKNGDKFCHKCGSSLLNYKNSKNNKRSVIIFSLITVLLILVLAGAVGKIFLFRKEDKGGKKIYENNSESFSVIGKVKGKPEYMAWVMDNDGKIGFISKDGEEIIPCKYDYADDFEDGFARVGVENGVDEEGEKVYLYGLVNKGGKEILQCQYDYVCA